MRKYVLICNNRRKKILYYYDFRDECVYCIDGGETSKNAEKGARKGGYYGGIIGILVLCQDLVQVKMRNFSPF